MAQSCMKEFMDAIPPAFCWKKTVDWGTIPNQCPDGYVKVAAECRKKCRDGYNYKWPSCWGSCGKKYKTVGPTCVHKKKPWKVKGKPSYVPDFGLVADIGGCPDGKHMVGLLCYEKCQKMDTGMVNCGPGGCARTHDTCVSTLADMTTDFISGISDLISFTFTLGASGSVSLFKEALESSMESVATNAL